MWHFGARMYNYYPQGPKKYHCAYKSFGANKGSKPVNYDKPMIDLVQEIRRRVPSENKPSIKLANPDLLSELVILYQKTTDNVMKALTRELMKMAGKEWETRLTTNSAAKGKYITHTYRGQTQLLEKPPTTPTVPREKKRFYRGQEVIV